MALGAEEWSRSTAGIGAPGADPLWSEMTMVWHNTHLTPALRIAEDHRIAGGLIYEGKLRETRTEVVHVTPKTWGGGSIYGSFCFETAWTDLAASRKLYWVEENHSYANPICRFLLSWYDVGHLPVVPYDPETHDGPLRLVNGKWFWLSTIVPEIVVDDPIYTSTVTQLTFDRHREDYCHYTRSQSCREMGVSGSGAAQASFVARLVGGGALGMEQLIVRDGTLTAGVYNALQSLWGSLFKRHEWGGAIADDLIATDAISGACLAHHLGDPDRAKRLMSLIDTEERAERLFLDLIRTRLDFPAFKWLD